MPTRSSRPPRSDVGSAAPPTGSAGVPLRLSARRLHDLALEAFRVGNRGRLSLCEALRVLSETRLYLELGFPGLSAYADTFFQLRRAETFEYVRVSKALLELTELREAFARGRIGWSALKAITRVATVASQVSWIDFARQNGVERTLAEARDALRCGRNAPREASFGLPNLDQRLVLRFSRSDMDKVRTWIESACAKVAEKTGAEEVSLEQAILFLCEEERISDARPGRSAVDGSLADDGQRAIPTVGDRSGPQRLAGDDGTDARGVSCPARIVYQHCPDCRRARVGTRDGFVEVASDEIDRYAGCAEPVVIDGPTPAGLRRRILAREAGRCGNPRCHHRADHCHHIVFRSRGGKSELANEVAVCTTCHALIHAGLLRVGGRADGELRWLPVASDESLQRAVASEDTDARRLPVLQLVAESVNRKRPADGMGESAIADSVLEPATGDGAVPARRALDLDELARGLMRLGVPAGRSRRMIGAAIEGLPPGEITEANVLRGAIASI